MPVFLRNETDKDHLVVAELVRIAFLNNPHSDGSESRIISRLRARRELFLSLVAVQDGEVVGYIAFSPITLAPEVPRWHGLGPLAVDPRSQGRGIGSMLVHQGLDELQAKGARGCVVFGNPAYYSRFGFLPHAGLVYPGGPSRFFLAQAFNGSVPQALVSYSPAFTDA